jgi:hypothetical protein
MRNAVEGSQSGGRRNNPSLPRLSIELRSHLLITIQCLYVTKKSQIADRECSVSS